VKLFANIAIEKLFKAKLKKRLMKIYKVNMRLMVCFEKKELTDLLLWPMEYVLLDKTLNARLAGKTVNLDSLKQLAVEFGKNSAGSRDYEYWASIFTLHEDVGVGSQICFYLKDTFNHNHDSITSYSGLKKFKEDPPDVIIRNVSGSLLEFELKRYRGALTEIELYNFIDKKIIKHYVGVAYNFCIILQHKPATILPELIFENLHKRIKKTSIKGDLGKICIIFNANNQYMIFAHIYPKLVMYKQPYTDGSIQAKKL